jgi:hypothetical protein
MEDEMSAGEWDGSGAPITMQKTLVLGDIRYLPHYQKPGVFVGPGVPAPEFGTHALVTAGAVEESYPLLVRGYNA